jgi:hypothetical protein
MSYFEVVRATQRDILARNGAVQKGVDPPSKDLEKPDE